MSDSLIIKNGLEMLTTIVNDNPESFERGYNTGTAMALTDTNIDIIRILDRYDASLTAAEDLNDTNFDDKDRAHMIGLFCGATAVSKRLQVEAEAII